MCMAENKGSTSERSVNVRVMGESYSFLYFLMGKAGCT